VHHEYRIPIGIQAAYSHPIDFVFGNLVPLTIVPYILEINAYLLPFLIILGIYKTVLVDHSDYSEKSQHHINHHKYYNCNYGAKWLDTIMNTNK
jgi:sterol desaturase/sphingolipid hydroxylase (fatty acid hydroxylase superfamily)